MALRLYIDKESVPVSIQRLNDAYFGVYTPLRDTPFTREVLCDIDQAEYFNAEEFYGRDSKTRTISREYLSTGAKTLLNIESHPDVCFDVLECGSNALLKLTRLHSGMIYWEYPVFLFQDIECDIEFDGVVYNQVSDLKAAIRRRLDNEGAR